MFTGLIERVGRLASMDRRGAGAVLRVTHDAWSEPLVEGESVAVQGACLTVVRVEPDAFECDALAETLDRTSLGRTQRGDRLNLERAMRATDRMGGHFVSGHVDGGGRLVERRESGHDWVLRIGCTPELGDGIVLKGSVACDGVSLTVSARADEAFEVSVIPFTWAHTSLSYLAPGDEVNIETDMLGKYVRRYTGAATSSGGCVTQADLERAGFL